MPYYDTVKFVCPSCKAPLTVENKKGDEGACGWAQHCVPIATAKQMVGEKVVCEECFQTLRIKPEAAEFVALQLVVDG